MLEAKAKQSRMRPRPEDRDRDQGQCYKAETKILALRPQHLYWWTNHLAPVMIQVSTAG